MNDELVQQKPAWVLNMGQQQAVDWLVRFCLGEDVGFEKVLLNGFAGTGKTFTINRMVEAVRKENPSINFGMTAPTHKAVRVLKRSSEMAHRLDFGTIHSFLGLKQVMLKQKDGTYKQEYKPDWNANKQRKIDGIRILIIDESSMLPDELFHFIEDEQRAGKLRVIYMGDEKQIPPVGKKQLTGESNAIPFLKSRQKSHRIHVLNLIEPQRQAANSPIIMYSVAIREQSARQKIDFDFTEEMKEHLEHIVPLGNKALVQQIFRQYFCTEKFQEDPDYVKVICWTNKHVDYFNREIRLLINNTTELPKMLEGEKLIMDEPLIEDKKVLLHNNDEVVSEEISLGEMELTYKVFPKTDFEQNRLLVETGDSYYKKTLLVKTYDCVLVNEDGNRYPVRILHEDSEKDFKELRENLLSMAKGHRDQWEQKELWKQYYGIIEHFAWVGYNYALTAHKAQGSTYDYCISMEWDIENNSDIEERNRIRYVAATRAKHKLYVIK